MILAVVLLAMTGMLFAAGQKESSAETQKAVKIWVGGQVAELDETWNKVMNDFTAQTGIPVDVQLFGFDVYYDKLITALQGGSGPDLAFADLGGWVPTFASNGWLESMDAQLKAWDGKDQIWENLWPTVTYKNELYGLPWYTDCRLLMYSKPMFREAGLDPNNPPETWMELVSAASKITNTEKRVYGYGQSGTKTEHTSLGFIIFLYGNGGQLLSDDYTKAAFNTPQGVEALQFYVDLDTKYGVSPNALSYNEDDYRNLMAQGRVAMAVGGPWSFSLIEDANPALIGDYTVSMHPYGKHPASVLGGWALVIPKASKNKDNAWKLAQYLDSKEVWNFWIDEKGSPMPARMDVCHENERFQGDEKWITIFDAFPSAVPRPPIPEYPQVSNEIQKMIQSVLLGQKTAKQAMAEAEVAVNSILKK